MKWNEILTIVGKSGLHVLSSRTKNGLIVESLTDKKRFPVFGNERISSLEEITMFGVSEDKPLRDIMKNIYEVENGGKAIDHKSSNEALKNYMAKIYPDYDTDRVYVSDMKKLFSWYNQLHDNDMLNFEDEDVAEEDSEVKEDEK
ncbi:MAG: DUF5606 domain-containing protein [Bacteroidales bacterium]|jgi:hypothetical protein|nr:DUF5606 domain-containing protein [Bacteroidales bacterium]